MLIFIGASASGKSDIAKILINEYRFKKMVTTTTRKKRANEVQHVDYHFTTINRFKKKQDNNYYGTPKKGADLNKVLIVDPDGANSIYDHHINNVVFFYLETDEEVRKKRMLERGDNLIEVIDRLEKDEKHFMRSNLKHIDYVINTNEGTQEEIALQIATLYDNHINNDNQMSIFDVFREDEWKEKK